MSEPSEPQDAKPTRSKEERRVAIRERVLRRMAAARLDNLQQRVAWILNRYPKARDSDLVLQIHFWEEFEPERGGGPVIAKEDLFHLTRLTSLTRARAKLQNTYKLFQASAEVRQARGTLAEEEKVKAAEQQSGHPVFDVYADESGKQGKHLIVGSVWCLHPPELLRFTKHVAEWREARGFRSEFHFHRINDKVLPHYNAFADELAERSSVFSFKAISVERSGVGHVDDALRQLYFHLLLRGIEHEASTRRGPLPRALQVWKDLEEPGRDKLFMEGLKNEIANAGAGRFNGQLFTEEFTAVDSKRNTLVQIADLYTSSINRVLNAEGARAGPKDSFADYLLGILGLPHGPTDAEKLGDMTIHISL